MDVDAFRVNVYVIFMRSMCWQVICLRIRKKLFTPCEPCRCTIGTEVIIIITTRVIIFYQSNTEHNLAHSLCKCFSVKIFLFVLSMSMVDYVDSKWLLTSKMTFLVFFFRQCCIFQTANLHFFPFGYNVFAVLWRETIHDRRDRDDDCNLLISVKDHNLRDRIMSRLIIE